MSTTPQEPKAKRPKIASLSRFRKFAKLRGLRCFNTVTKMIEDGYPLTEIAEFIQGECGEYVDVRRDSLVKVLGEYKGTLPVGSQVAMGRPKDYLAAARKLRDGVNVLEELESLYRVQKARVDHWADHEQDTGEMSKNMAREVDSARNLVHEIHHVRMDLGIDDRHIGTLTLQAEATAAAEERYGGEVADVLRDPEKRRKLITIMEIAMRKPPPALPEGQEVIEVEAEGTG